MPDREKIIKGLKCRMSESRCYKCPYTSENECENGTSYYSKAIEDAITLLKAQESVPVYENKISKCKCGEIVYRYHYPKFCGFCGRELLWY